MRIAAHFWTIAPSLAHRVRPEGGPACVPWSTTVADPRWGSVRLTGLLRRHPDPKGLVLIVHGMGGRPTSHYCVRAAGAAEAAGFSSLRLALRGADRLGEDFYHAGLTADLRAALDAPEIRDHAAFYLLGYSLGGHVSLRLACERETQGLRAVATVCPPLDLVATAHALDHEVPALYRLYVLGGLKSIYAQVARRREVPSPVEAVARVRTVREWDELAVVPRHGFASVDAYYEGESVAPRLRECSVPGLVIAADDDPLVPTRTTRAVFSRPMPGIELKITHRGGHVAFPTRLDLGLPGSRGLEHQVMGWFQRH
jgi:predicted alpha/beta-fold hydrolase